MGVVCAPIMTYLCWEIHHGYMDAFMDHWTWRLSNLFTMATVANTLLLNVDRYVAIVHPLRFLGSQMRSRIFIPPFNIKCKVCFSLPGTRAAGW